ncbi:MAG TPA: YfhO family protein [Ferruginibacter sp.]|nr:YfhO family protein [Ferruginibacter sp.]HMP21722.1 YfhO family protein [Ferruginibacter sp.]
MKQINLKSLLPHGVAIIIFLLVTVIFCKPALEADVVLQQSDVTAVQSMRHQSDVYKEQKGKFPLWISSMFSGMPAYNIIYDGPKTPFSFISKAFELWLPKPLNFFFLCCICFYIFCLCIKIRPYLGIFASLAFAYATYNPILVVAGHDTKLQAMAYAPALIGSVLLLFDKKYIPGFILTALFAGLHLMQNHQQITYYVLIIIGIMTLFFIARWVKEKQLAHAGKAIGLAAAAAGIALIMNAILIFPVYDFAKYSKRGGQLILDEKKEQNSSNKAGENKTTGLSRDYAFQWSNEPKEALSIIFPGIAGYGSYFSQRDGEYNIFPKLSETSHTATYLQEKLNMPEDQAANIAANFSGRLYWGGKPFTSGPAYIGAVICALFVLGMFLLDGRHKWWILTASLVGIALSLGKYFPALNNFLFDHLPLYNKFRTPEMALVIPQILFPILAVLTADKLLDTESKLAFKKIKPAAIAMGALFVLAGGIYFSSDYTKENKKRTAAINEAFTAQDQSLNDKLREINAKYEAETDNRIYEELLYQTKGDTQTAKGIVTAIRQDRQAFLGSDILRALLFTLLALGIVALFAWKKINAAVLTAGLTLLVLIDLLPMGMHYVNEKSFETADRYEQNEFAASEADKNILADKDPNYRVFSLTGGDPFQDAKPSYFHKSIGGYHPAKIGIYDDLATYQLSKMNQPVINMLNTKYFIQEGADGKTPMAIPNPGALGNCWFVKGAKFVNGPVEEMKALDNFEPKDTAVIDAAYKNIIVAFQPADSTASIKQVSFDNMEIQYESSSNATNLAVFSEIFYKDWNAYIDGVKVPVAKANYVLRALEVPAGKHSIVFKFEPKVFNTSYTLSMIGGWLMFALLLWFAYYSFKNSTAKQ